MPEEQKMPACAARGDRYVTTPVGCYGRARIRHRDAHPAAARSGVGLRLLGPDVDHFPVAVHRSGTASHQFRIVGTPRGSRIYLGHWRVPDRLLVRPHRSPQAISARGAAGVLSVLDAVGTGDLVLD